MAQARIGILVGSLREGSYTKSIAKALSGMLASKDFALHFLELGDLPMYNQDLDVEGKIPPAWLRLREDVKAMDGFLFVTPEYNRSVPAVLKNALDIASRPMGQNAWDGKPAAIVSVSPSSMGGFGANHHLRQSFVFLNMFAMQQPEAYLNNVTDCLDDNGNVIKPDTVRFLQKISDGFEAWVKRFGV